MQKEDSINFAIIPSIINIMTRCMTVLGTGSYTFCNEVGSVV